ncbi:DUF961 family protein [Bacillus sp. TV3D]|uniref:DUF961 family protein n=1 Tax=Bacillus sp. TV3D TaxID=3447562 RepID=UPI003EDA9959
MELKFIVPNNRETFGDCKFLGFKREKYVYDQVNQKRTDELESRTYNLAASCQGGPVEVILPASCELKEYDFMENVELINPIIEARATSNGNFANINWVIRADDIVIKGSNNNSSKVTPTATTNDKK